MTDRYIQIESASHLVRDKVTMAVLNTDSAGLKAAKENKAKRISQQKKVEILEKDVHEIKNTLGKILELLEKK